MSRLDTDDSKQAENLDLVETCAEDIAITCVDCDSQFTWSVGEQEFFRDKGLENPPKRCKPCKKAKTSRIDSIKSSKSGFTKQKIEVPVDCAKCGERTTVPFYPSQDRPVFCRSCFLAMNPQLLGTETE